MDAILNSFDTSTLSQYIQFFLNVINVFLVYKIAHRISKNEIIKYLNLSIVFLLIVDIVYFVVYSIPSKMNLIYIFDVFHFAYFTLTIGMLLKIINRFNISKYKLFIVLTTIFVLVIMVFDRFSIQKNYFNNHLTIRQFIQLLQSIVDLFIFSLVIITLIYTKLRSLNLIIFSYGVLTASEFTLTACYISGVDIFLDSSEIIWTIGLIFQTIGLLYFIYEKKDDSNKWFRDPQSINIRISIWSFIITSVSFIMFCVLISSFAIVNSNFFILFPVILMLYSLFIVYSSIVFGIILEQPFKKIQKVITNTLISNDVNTSQQFTISEFTFLYTQLNNAILLKKQKDEALEKINKKIAIAAHDMRSQISTMRLLWPNIENNPTNTDVLKIVNNSINRLHVISNDLLKNRKDATASNKLIILEDCIKNLIRENILLYSDCKLKLSLNNNSIIFINQVELERRLLNILNNAYESLVNSEKEIYITTTVRNNNAILIIQDTGCGIHQDYIESIMGGTSLKQEGNGIGLSSSVEYFKSIGGLLHLTSSENDGTTVLIKIPLSYN